MALQRLPACVGSLRGPRLLSLGACAWFAHRSRSLLDVGSAGDGSAIRSESGRRMAQQPLWQIPVSRFYHRGDTGAPGWSIDVALRLQLEGDRPTAGGAGAPQPIAVLESRDGMSFSGDGLRARRVDGQWEVRAAVESSKPFSTAPGRSRARRCERHRIDFAYDRQRARRGGRPRWRTGELRSPTTHRPASVDPRCGGAVSPLSLRCRRPPRRVVRSTASRRATTTTPVGGWRRSPRPAASASLWLRRARSHRREGVVPQRDAESPTAQSRGSAAATATGGGRVGWQRPAAASRRQPGQPRDVDVGRRTPSRVADLCR